MTLLLATPPGRRALALLLAAAGLASCRDPVDQAAKRRIFSPEDPPQAVAAASERLAVEALGQDAALARRVLGIGAAEATERLGPHRVESTISWEWRQGAQAVRLKEKRTLLAGPGGVSGDFAAALSNSNDQGIEVTRVGLKVFARSTYGKDGAGVFRERLRDRGMAERIREEAFGAVAAFDTLFRGRLALEPAGDASHAGRPVARFKVSLSGYARTEDPGLPPPLVPRGGLDDTTARRLAFFNERHPVSIRGELAVDQATAVVLSARLEGRMSVSGDAGVAELSLRVDSELSGIGQAPRLTIPEKYLPDEDKPLGIAAALERFGFRRGDAGVPSARAAPPPAADESDDDAL